MEEQRIGFMYVNLVRSKLQGAWDNLFPRGFRRSRALPFVIIFLVIALPLAAYTLHMHGKFGSLKRQINGEVPAGPPPGPHPGGLDPIILSRTQAGGGNMPEFHSVTILPGLGMDVLQISAFLPNRGETPLLVNPSLEEMDNGGSPTREGSNDRFGAIEMPWSGLLTGALAPIGTSFRTTWKGRMIEAPADTAGRGTAEGGMLFTLGADSTVPSPAGASVKSVVGNFNATDFNQHWSSRTDIKLSVAMSAQAVDITVVAKNVGDQVEPLGIGWHPRFAIPSGNREAAEVRLPNGEVQDVADHIRGLPSGHIVPSSPAIARFQAHATAIGAAALDTTIVRLRPGALDSGASVEFRDPASEFGLRMTSTSASTRAIRVVSPAGSSYVSLGVQTNYDDPLGKEWIGVDGAPIDTLQPGESATWKVRLELFPVNNSMSTAR